MKDILSIIINLMIIGVIVRVWMIVARYIGEQLGISNLFEYILNKLKKNYRALKLNIYRNGGKDEDTC